MVETITVSPTLELEIVSGGALAVVRIDRTDGGLVAVRPAELRPLVAGLVTASGLLAAGEAARAAAGPGQDGDQERGA